VDHQVVAVAVRGCRVAIAHSPVLAVDCPDPAALATFYGTMLGWAIEVTDDRAAVRAESGQCISFHRVEGFVPPTWPSQDTPQQMHLDVLVDDIDAAEAAVLDLGAIRSEHQPGTSYRVFLDPAGHPFCLCVD
jgi:predicted enzyme related to lactoylglutathione lyase